MRSKWQDKSGGYRLYLKEWTRSSPPRSRSRLHAWLKSRTSRSNSQKNDHMREEEEKKIFERVERVRTPTLTFKTRNYMMEVLWFVQLIASGSPHNVEKKMWCFSNAETLGFGSHNAKTLGQCAQKPSVFHFFRLENCTCQCADFRHTRSVCHIKSAKKSKHLSSPIFHYSMPTRSTTSILKRVPQRKPITSNLSFTEESTMY